MGIARAALDLRPKRFQVAAKRLFSFVSQRPIKNVCGRCHTAELPLFPLLAKHGGNGAAAPIRLEKENPPSNIPLR